MSKLIAMTPPSRAPLAEKLPWVNTFTVAVAEKICEAVAEGRTLSQIGKENWAPNARVIVAWQADYPEFRANYEEARRVRADHLAQEIVALADGAKSDLDLAKLPHQIHAREWLAAKMSPKEYGDRRVIEQNINANVRTASVSKLDVSHLSMEELRFMSQVMRKAIGEEDAAVEEED